MTTLLWILGYSLTAVGLTLELLEIQKKYTHALDLNESAINEMEKAQNAVCNIAKILRQQCECCEDKQSELCNADCKIKVILKIIKKTKEGK